MKGQSLFSFDRLRGCDWIDMIDCINNHAANQYYNFWWVMLIEKLQAAGFDVGVFYHQELELAPVCFWYILNTFINKHICHLEFLGNDKSANYEDAKYSTQKYWWLCLLDWIIHSKFDIFYFFKYYNLPCLRWFALHSLKNGVKHGK